MIIKLLSLIWSLIGRLKSKLIIYILIDLIILSAILILNNYPKDNDLTARIDTGSTFSKQSTVVEDNQNNNTPVNNEKEDDQLAPQRSIVYEVNSIVDSYIRKAYFKVGDKVKAGDLMFILDDTNARANIDKLKSELQQLNFQSKKLQDSLSKLKIIAPFDGLVTDIQVSNFYTLSKGETILTLTDNSKLKITALFSAFDIKDIKAGQKAKVSVWTFMENIDGIVTFVPEKPIFTDKGEIFYKIEVTVDNPGALQEGMDASVEIITPFKTVQGLESSILSYMNILKIKSELDGKVINLTVRDHQQVSKGNILVELKNDNITVALEEINLKIKDLQKQLAYANKQLKLYKVYAPVSGEMAEQSVADGNTVKVGQVLSSIKKD